MANYALLKRAYTVLEVIPEKQIDLGVVLKVGRVPKSCGTIACGLGHLGLHPYFRALGFRTTKEASIKWHGKPYSWESAAAEMFDISNVDALKLFRVAHFSEKASWGSDKDVLLHRLRSYLEKEAQLEDHAA
jgi:hypothetical protein